MARKNLILTNPFPTVGYHGPKYFCDREVETEQLLTNIYNGNSTTLIAIRRIGKTGLIHHTLGKLTDGWKGVYVDILATENLNQLLNHLATSIIQSVPENSSFGKKTWNFIKSLRPVITFDALTGQPQASFDFKQSDIELNISSVLRFIDDQNSKTVIAIDEFQQIVHYPEKNTDAWFRGIVQQLHNVVFIFSGSQQHLMSEIFASPSRPFFRSTQMLKLEKINFEVYAKFIEHQFKSNGKQISPEIVNDIISWCGGHTYYVQLLCNRVFSSTQSVVSDEIWKKQAVNLLSEQEQIFINYRNLLTNHQWQLLKAIALEGQVNMPTGKYFITKYKLGSSATITRSLGSLTKYELIYKDVNSSGESFYSVYDILFQQWTKERGVLFA